MSIYKYLNLPDQQNLKDFIQNIILPIKIDHRCSQAYQVVKLLADVIGFEETDPKELEASDYKDLIGKLNMMRVRANFMDPIFCRIHEFIFEFCGIAYNSEVFFGGPTWLEKCTQFLFAMHDTIDLKILAAFLSSCFVAGFHYIYCDINEARTNNMKIVLGKAVSEEQIALLETRIERADDLLTEVKNLCWKYMKLVLPATRSKELGIYMTEKMCKLFETSDLICQQNGQLFLNFHLQCLNINNVKLLSTVLKSLKNCFQSSAISYNEKRILMNHLVNTDDGKILYILARHSSIMIIEEILWILVHIHKSGFAASAWTIDQYETILLNILSAKVSVRNLAGELMLLLFYDDSEQNTFCKILDFFVNYNMKPSNFAMIIESIWDFNYMKDFQNIFILFKYADAENVRNAVLAHFTVAMIKRLVSDKDYEEQRILQCLKLIPRVFEHFECYPILYRILLDVFRYVDLIMIEPHYIGDHKYVDHLIKSLKLVLLKRNDYKLFQSAIYAFIKLRDIGYNKANIEFNRTLSLIYEKFKNAHLHWERTREKIDEMHFEALVSASSKISIALTYECVFNKEQEDALFKVIQNAVITQTILQKSDKFKQIGIFYFDSLSSLLIIQLIDIINMNNSDQDHIQFINICIRQLIDILEKLLVPSQCDLFFLEKIVKTLIHLNITIQPSVLFNTRVELQNLVSTFDSESYNRIIDVCNEIIFNCEISDTTDVNEIFEAFSLKQEIFSHLIRLHRDYIGLKPSNQPYKIIKNILNNTQFENEIFDFILTIANYKSPFEPNGFRVSGILSVVLIHFSDESKTTQKKAILKKLVQLFKKELPEQYEQIFTSITLQTILKLYQILLVKSASYNRLFVLNLLKPFVINDENCRVQIIAKLQTFNGLLRKDERSTLKRFHDFVLQLH